MRRGIIFGVLLGVVGLLPKTLEAAQNWTVINSPDGATEILIRGPYRIQPSSSSSNWTFQIDRFGQVVSSGDVKTSSNVYSVNIGTMVTRIELIFSSVGFILAGGATPYLSINSKPQSKSGPLTFTSGTITGAGISPTGTVLSVAGSTLVVTKDGMVGVGIAAPGSRLDVTNSAAGADDGVRIFSTFISNIRFYISGQSWLMRNDGSGSNQYRIIDETGAGAPVRIQLSTTIADTHNPSGITPEGYPSRTAIGFLNARTRVATLQVSTGTQINNLWAATVSNDPASVAAVTTLDISLGLTGLTIGDNCMVQAPALEAGLLLTTIGVLAANTLTVRIGNITAIAINPASQNFDFVCFRD